VNVAIDLPPGASPRAFYRVDSTENNVIARWRELGSPAYWSREQTRELAADNSLRAAPSQSIRVERNSDSTTAHFTMESPGVGLLEIEI
jgi:hypothetical protein